ncbi:MAG: ribosomal protein [Fibrobacteres bacterium]|nr:ribosomal protein [Fibrobacterota bacterium]
MSVPEIKEMLEAGIHFGHLTKRWNPKMKKFILTEKNGIYVIDLSKTQECLQKATDAVKKIRHSGKSILFVGTKKTIKECMKEEAVRCGQYYVTERWLGGMLTNFSTVKKSIKRLEEIEKMETDGLFKEITKKEVLSLNKERAKLEGIFSGIRNMKTLPGALFVVDSEHEEIAVHEANRLKIPVFAIVDTNSDPDKVAYPIPGNDDAIKSVGLLTRVFSDAIVGVKAMTVEDQQKAAAAAAAPALAEVLEGAE